MGQIQFQHPETPGLVSVVIPTRNGDRFIGAALESIGRQTYTSWEVLVIEDGSVGETEAIVARFAAEHPDRRVHYQRNAEAGGAAFTRNVAFGVSAGEWVAFLDCDDRWLPDHLKTCVDALAESGDDVAYSAAAMCEDGSDHVIGFWGPTHNEIDEFPHSLLGRSFVTPSATVVRRSVIADVGPWNTECRYCEDADFFLRAASLGKRFRCVGGVHCLYRKNHQGATTQKMAGTIEEWATIAEWFIDSLGDNVGRNQRKVARAYTHAARLHAKSDQELDPSATRSRAASLFYKAWTVRPKRIGYLLQAARYAAFYGATPNPALPSPPAAVEAPSAQVAMPRLAA